MSWIAMLFIAAAVAGATFIWRGSNIAKLLLTWLYSGEPAAAAKLDDYCLWIGIILVIAALFGMAAILIG